MSDLYTFLEGWFSTKFPEFVNNALYISGESFGGHYVPQLTWTILNRNKKSPKVPLNLKGMLVGNPWTDDKIDGGSVPFWIYSHALCSLDTWQLVEKECGVTAMPDVRAGYRDYHGARQLLQHLRPQFGGPSCDSALNEMYGEIGDRINQLCVG